MWSPVVVEVQVVAERGAGVADAVVGSQIHLLIFDAAPQPLDEHVVSPGAFAVHADCNAVAGEHAGEGRARELRALVGIEDVRLAVTSQRILQRFHAERCLHRDRQPPRQHAAAEPVEHHGQIDEAARHRDVGDVHRPHLVRSRDRHPTQQIRVDFVAGLGLGRARTAIKRLNRHPLHQRLHVTTSDLAPLGHQQAAQHPRAGEGELQMQPVETPHDRQPPSASVMSSTRRTGTSAKYISIKALRVQRCVQRLLHAAANHPVEVALDPLVVNRDDVAQRTDVSSSFMAAPSCCHGCV